ncbi:MAG: hypothetical protein ACYTFY_23095, partial [Planctomycetota bacterium]
MSIANEILSSIAKEDIKSLSGACENVTDFIEEHMIDSDGLFYCHVNVATLKPWTDEEFAARNYFTHFHNMARGGTMGVLAYEDSLMATAEYALSQIICYEKADNDKALVTASRHITTILNVMEEGDKFEKGYLPKPHGGLSKASWSHEISHDQYIKCVVSLNAYKKYASESLKKVIDERLVQIADYFYNRDFRYPRRESMVVTPEARPHVLALFVPVLVIAGNLTGDKKYSKALEQFSPIIDKIATETEQVNTNASSLMIEGFHLALQEGCKDMRLKDCLVALWDRHLDFVDDEGKGPEDSTQDFNSSRILRIPSFAPLIDFYCPEKEAYKAAIHILKSQQNPKEMLYANAEEDTMHPAHKYRVHS